MKIYIKPNNSDPKDRLLEDLIKEENLTLDNPAEDWFDRLLKESKVEYDETWMAEAESKMPEGMEERLLAKIQELEKEEKEKVSIEAPVIKMTPKSQKQPPRLWIRVAACLAIIMAIGIGINMQGSNNAFADTCKTPEEAQMQLERALTLLSKNKVAIQTADETLQQATQPQENALSKFITIK